MTFAEGTAVPVERSRAEVETILRRYGAASFIAGWDAERAVIGFIAHGRNVRFVLPLPAKDEQRFTHVPRSAYKRRTKEAALAAWEAERRRLWRALALAIKAKLEVVESGIATFESEFLAHIVLPGGKTVGETALPEIAASYESGDAPLRLLGSGA